MIKHVEIENRKGFILRGYLNLPPTSQKMVVMFHGFTGNKTEHAGHFRNLSRLFGENSIASLRLDFHGNGESDGEFEDFGCLDALDDAKRILSYAKLFPQIKEVYILGYSFGGFIASLIANDNDCAGLMLVSPAANMAEIVKRIYDTGDKCGEYVTFSCFKMSKKFVDEVCMQKPYGNTDKLNKNVLIVQARDDMSVPYTYGVRYATSYKNSRLVLIADAGHGYDQQSAKEKLYSSLLEFVVKGR